MSQCKCTKELYKAFLQASSVRYSGLALSEVSPIELSHESISHRLRNKWFRPREIWEISERHINKKSPCLLIGDNTVLAEIPNKKIHLVSYQYPRNQHDVIAGIGLINLLWYGLEEESSVPIDYRIYGKNTDRKTKNTNFCDMLSLAKARGLTPEGLVIDSWYSSLKNLKAIRDHGWEWITSLRKNRKVNRNDSLENLIIPAKGLRVHLRGYGWVTVFKFVAKNGRIDYITTNRETPTREQIKPVMKARWSIEVYHRESK